VVWVGAGALGSTDGRVRLVFRDQVDVLVPDGDPDDRPDGELHDAIRARLEARGASFWPDLVTAAAEAGAGYDETEVLTALWDLVWAGEVTNDSLAALRAFLGSGPSRRGGGVGGAKRGRGSRPRPGRLSRLGPPAGAGRWSLVEPLRQPLPNQPAVTATEVAHARANQLLERYGVLTREAALGEGIEGGFAGVYPILKALEERGNLRRGYFVAGLGAAQFALPGAVDRLRAARTTNAFVDDEPPAPLVLAATDPAQPYGAALPWPESGGRPARAAGAHVVVADGDLVAYVERGGKSLATFPAAAEHPGWPDALGQLLKRGRYRSLEIGKVDGVPARESAVADDLRAAGFVDGYKGLVLHR